MKFSQHVVTQFNVDRTMVFMQICECALTIIFIVTKWSMLMCPVAALHTTQLSMNKDGGACIVRKII